MLVNKKSPSARCRGRSRKTEERGIYDSFANYVVFCPDCRSCIKTNMYLQSAEMYLEKLSRDDTSCPSCGGKNWTLGYPMGSRTGFVKE